MDKYVSSSSSSKVKVEYSDPSNSFAAIASDFHGRLPLRNLHWNSPTRPLRSIESLYVDLVPDEKTALPRRPGSATGTSTPEGPPTLIGVDGKRQLEASAARKERRHQIPGLRQTPYLKVYILRCDDSEAYKATARKALREWIKSNTPPAQNSASTNSQENHDAFEWLILHVVPLDVQGGQSWPSKVSSGVLEKIKSDFNSSKGADRVAQVPVAKSLPTGLAKEQFLVESGRAWDDTLAKLKSLILASFDLRVRQYEEDIKEKSAQRSIPGWNFCTFFVLKEGLARGFESVGLVDDALAGYDELAAELESIIREEKEKATEGKHTDLFRETTPELSKLATSALVADSDAVDTHEINDFSILDAERKPYRELILANNISILDFVTYIFAKQISILSRIAVLSGPLGNFTERESADVLMLVEICQRSIDHMTNTGRIIRDELKIALPNVKSSSEIELANRHNLIDNLTASWILNATQEILNKTENAQLEKELQSIPGESFLGHGSRPSTPQTGGVAVASPQLAGHPGRTTSLVGKSTPVTSPYDDMFGEDASLASRMPTVTQPSDALYQLAGMRAELCLLGRRALVSMALKQGWEVGRSIIDRDEEPEELADVSLDSDASDKRQIHSTSSISPQPMAGILNPRVRENLKSEEEFYADYEQITVHAYRLCQLAGDQKSASALLSDIAIVRFQLKDYAGAATQFHKLAPFYAKTNWTELEVATLAMYAKCLKRLERTEDYVRIELRMLSKALLYERPPMLAVMQVEPAQNKLRGVLSAVMEASASLERLISVNVEEFFRDVAVNPYVSTGNREGGGFTTELTGINVMPDDLNVQQTKVYLAGPSEPKTREIVMISSDNLIRRGKFSITVSSETLIPGWYTVKKITLQTGKVVFVHDYQQHNEKRMFSSTATTESATGSDAPSRILLWPYPGGLEIEALLTPSIHLDQARSITLTLKCGTTGITNGRLAIRAASAGLRLHTANAMIEDEDDADILEGITEKGVLCLKSLDPNQAIHIVVPYGLEADVREISVGTEISYRTEHGEAVYADSHAMSVLLPLGVNVQDIFKKNALFSKFSLSSATNVPLRILGCHLDGTRDFEATSPLLETHGLSIFVKQPLSVIYKITRKATSKTQDLQARLSMQIRYVCLDEEILVVASEHLSRAVETSQHAPLVRLLVRHLASTLRGKFSGHELEVAGLLREISIGSYESLGWDEVLIGLPSTEHHNLRTWLREWHAANEVITLPDEHKDYQTRQITIPVDVPQMHVVHTARLRILPGATPGQRPLAVGEAVAAELVVQYSRSWDTERTRHVAEQLEFSYELEANPDVWLIGGQRRAHYSAAENEDVIFPLVLIPQGAGYLPYPSIDIRHDAAEGKPATSSEVDWRNQGQSVLVMPGYKSTTVSLDGENGGGWLVESDRWKVVV